MVPGGYKRRASLITAAAYGNSDRLSKSGRPYDRDRDLSAQHHVQRCDDLRCYAKHKLLVCYSLQSRCKCTHKATYLCSCC